MSSIHGKITLGYLALAAGVGGFVLFASADLRYLETRVQEGVVISGFQETAQEMRRHEKNYFLYRAADELETARNLAAGLAGQLETQAPAFARVARGSEIESLRRAIAHYRQRVQAPVDDERDEAAIRAAGHDLTERADRLAQRERTALVESLHQSRLALFWSVGVVALLALVGGQVLYRAVGRPLRRLEAQLEPLAEGRYQAFSQVSADREIVSFTAALNHMLEELELRRRQVVQSEKLASLGTLASGVAHELNNPLGNISGACQILMEEVAALAPLSGKTRQDLLDWLTQIDDETERARRIVRTLLDYSRKPGQGRVPTSLAAILEKSLVLLNPRLPESDSVVSRIPPDLYACVDPQRLQQVFINLIQNALNAGARRVTLDGRTGQAGDWPPPDAGLVLGDGADPAREMVLVTLRDDGHGIPADRLDHVFEPFYSTREPGEGTGLGLYIVGEIIQEKGGAIAVHSAPGRGTTFTLRLPGREKP